MYYLRASSILALFAISHALTAPPRARAVSNDTSSASRGGLAGGTHLSPSTLAACAAAPNCETYEHPVFGTHIRFVDGMGPGSAHYARHVDMRRDGEVITSQVTAGKNKLNYGSVKASGPDGAIHHLYDICYDSTCEGPAVISSNFADMTAPWSGDILLSATGQYANIDERDAFVAALVEVAAHNESCWTQEWSHGEYNGGYSSGSVDMCKQSNFLNVNRWADGNLRGFLSVTAQLMEPESGSCDAIFAALADIAGIIAAIPGLEAVGGAVTFFGLVGKPACG